jgi:NAD(P)H-hydrate epimerase
MVRAEVSEITNPKLQIPNKFKIQNLKELKNIADEGGQTAALTNYLLRKYPRKQWVIDAGALQMMDVALIPPHAILTPHHGEFKSLCARTQNSDLNDQTISDEEKTKMFAKAYQCVVLLKGQADVVASPTAARVVEGGNAGMTKGGTGDVLAGLVAALACKNDPFTAAAAGSYLNKQAGEALFRMVGPYFNASDLAQQIPRTMKELLRS